MIGYWKQAEKHGTMVERERVDSIHLDQKVRIEVAGKELEYDLVVLASGVN